MNSTKNFFDLSGVTFIKTVTVGSINPNTPFSENERDVQIKLLNRCLNDFPKGKIIGSDKTVATYMLGQHQLVMEKTTYHIGFKRKPLWIGEEEKNSGK
ncbi:MAG: hypothetical protein NC452_17385 [Eubacterium sp.]|nr:hypothetical protein [Eubacterium sp.]